MSYIIIVSGNGFSIIISIDEVLVLLLVILEFNFNFGVLLYIWIYRVLWLLKLNIFNEVFGISKFLKMLGNWIIGN